MARIPIAASFCVMCYFAETMSVLEPLEPTCSGDVGAAVKGLGMVQIRQTVPTSSCSMQHAKEQPLTEAGFQEVSKSCCYEDIKGFVRRIIDDMGLKVCDEGGLSGIAPFYSCPQNPVTLSELRDELSKALPAGNSKCKWLEDRYEACAEPALECAVSAQRPPPAPKPVASGFIAFKVENPSEMLRSSRAIEVMKNELSLSLGISTASVNVIIGSGPLDGEEVVSSLFLVPKSQAYFVKGKAKLCKVFAVYSIQEQTPKKKTITTPAPTLDENDVIDSLKRLDVGALGRRLTQDLVDVDRVVGKVEVTETTICERTSLKCTHEVVKGATD